MPWESIQLNDGTYIPSIAFGTWAIGYGQTVINKVDRAISVGFGHIDTAPNYRNEAEAGIAIRESGLAREDVYITTKYSILGMDVATSVQNSLKYLGVTYIDLFLLHHPLLGVPDIPTVWRQIEDLKAKGLVKSIGVSNFEVKDLEILMNSAKITPAINQIFLHPYACVRQAPILEYCARHNILIGAYSPLTPVTHYPGGTLDPVLYGIAGRLGVTAEEVLLAYVKAKGAYAVTTSSKKDRLERYLRAGDLGLTREDVAALEKVGAQGPNKSFMVYSKIVGYVALFGVAALGTWHLSYQSGILPY